MIHEAESTALRDELASEPHQFASVIVEVEVLRAVRRVAPDLVPAARAVVSQLAVVELGEPIRKRAAALDPPALRALDAIHVATALEAGAELEALVAYDVRLQSTAEAHGLAVLAPR